MLLLTLTTDKLQIITGSALALDVHASFVDLAAAVTTPGRQNTAIATAATTDIVAAPGASTVRNVQTMTARNKDAAASNAVTVVFNQNGTSFELWKGTLLAGDSLQFLDGVGFFVLTAAPVIVVNANTADVVANAADTYLAGSSLAITGKIKAGSTIRWKFRMTKTGAGVATPIYNLRVGTAGAVGDTSRGTFTGLAQTAVIDAGYHELEAIIRVVGASGIIQSMMTMHHGLATTGLANAAQVQLFAATSAAFDLTAAGLIIGVSCNPGASGVWTFQHVSVVAAF